LTGATWKRPKIALRTPVLSRPPDLGNSVRNSQSEINLRLRQREAARGSNLARPGGRGSNSSGEHLVLLARRSDAVLEALMALVFQPGQSGEDVVDTARRLIATALVTLDRREKRDVSGRSRKGSG
jgi:hypothetical protein